ncbi:hypothetical protein CKO_02191 [Citrobacter koseri ATCC BAA-895]|uniref:Uncharacterized protein n=1 Tax=Citrobacter koseri (strain ATCC BAA-895 / CDC 4225-83 / SGSC4696) TaxID=290338 RepID=A8AIK2_CITK8|nr:hypothetical protein CKO_02191 [Citrobacter koseri ATCC BAA-895]
MILFYIYNLGEKGSDRKTLRFSSINQRDCLILFLFTAVQAA